MKVGDLVFSTAFENQNGIIIECGSDINGNWYEVVWLSVSIVGHREWCRSHEFEIRDIS